jgi:hypothetical protein
MQLSKNHSWVEFQVDCGYFLPAPGIEETAGRQLCAQSESQSLRLNFLQAGSQNARETSPRRISSLAEAPKADFDPDYVPKPQSRAPASAKKRPAGVTDASRKAAKKTRKSGQRNISTIQSTEYLANIAPPPPFHLDASAMLVNTGVHCALKFERYASQHIRCILGNDNLSSLRHKLQCFMP